MVKQTTQSPLASPSFRPPVVAVLGHVDHGKTSLLDAIRKTNIALGEHGGITQAIGAYQVEIATKEGKRPITFIDTPGHEAFSKMRSRGATTSDIVLLVIDSTDGIMPQTKESIAHIIHAKVPFIVVLTKTDLPTANPDKVKQQLLASEVLVEGMGGNVPVISVSSKTGQGIQELLELILLVWQMQPEYTVQTDVLESVIIESKRDQRRGPVATVIIRSGTLSIGDMIVADTIEGKVRALVSYTGENIKHASIGMPVEILGFSDVPAVGSKVLSKAAHLSTNQQATTQRAPKTALSPDVLRLPLILKADTHGSLEAILASIPKDDVELILIATGDIVESDVLLAKPSGAIIIGFNVSIAGSSEKLAETEGVLIHTYKLIYQLLEELSEAIAMYKEGKPQEIVLGIAQIQAIFPYERKRVAGSKVLEGRVAKGDKVRLMRGEESIGETRIVSLRVGKEGTGKVEAGQECGILLNTELDFQPQDMILSVR